MSAARGGGSASLDMADFPGSGDRGTSLNGSESSAFGVNGRALDAPVHAVAALFAAEGERAVSYLCTSARPITFADVDAQVERAFVQVREHWSDSLRYSRPVVFAFATLQRALTGQLPIGSGTPDAVVQSTVAAAGKGDLARVIALQNALDLLPAQQRQSVVLRELSRFTPIETSEILQTPEAAVEAARMDALRALIWTLDRGTPSGAPGSYQLAPEDFAALAGLVNRGDRRRADAQRQLLASLAPAVGAPLEPYRPAPPTVSAPRSRPAQAPAAPSQAPPSFEPPATQSFVAPPSPTLPAPAQAPLSFESSATQPFVTAPQPSWPQPAPRPTLPAASPPTYAATPAAVRIDELGEWYPSEADRAGMSRGSTPIFDEISAWFSAGPLAAPTGAWDDPRVVDLRSDAGRATSWEALHDDGWLAANERAAASPQIAGSTDAGLPRRRPGANRLPSATDSAVRPLVSGRDQTAPSANDVRRRLDGFQQGLRTARQVRSHVQEPATTHAHTRSHAATERRSTDDTKEIVFGAFYNGYLPHLLAQLMAQGARPAAAAEVAQDAMAAAYQSWEQISAPEEWTRTWALNAFTNPTASGTRPWEAPPASSAPASDSGSLFDSGH